MLKVGDVAPDFRVQAHTGEQIQLSAYASRPVVLWFYPRADTGGWTLEGLGFRDRIHEFDAYDAVVLGVSRDSIEDNAAFAAKNDFPYRLLSDTSGELCQAYQTCGDEPGSLAQRISYVIGPDGHIALALEQIAPAEHAEQALAFLTTFGEAT